MHVKLCYHNEELVAKAKKSNRKFQGKCLRLHPDRKIAAIGTLQFGASKSPDKHAARSKVAVEAPKDLYHLQCTY